MFWALSALLTPLPPSTSPLERTGQLVTHYAVSLLLLFGGARLIYSYRKHRKRTPEISN
jgi:hypothetical protein